MRTRTCILVALLGGIGVAATLSMCLPGGNYLNNWLASSALGIPAIFGLLCAWRFGRQEASKGRALAWMVAAAFLLRLALGVFFALALPDWGNDQPAENAGYIYSDAYNRDKLAWEMAEQNQPVAAAFQQGGADQYGGLLALSTIVYRLISPDFHRPWLILLMGAFSAAAGVPFLWRGLQRRWGTWVANLATWIFVLYPESLLLGASQMREPFLLGLSAIAFWAVLDEQTPLLRRQLVLGAVLGGMVLLSPPVGLVTAAVTLGWMFLEQPHKRRWLVWALMGAGVVVFLALIWNWLWLASSYDSYLSERASGWIQELRYNLPSFLFRTFLVGYGMVQPVLPATFFEPALELARTISIFRAAGWYLLAPFLIFGVFATWKARPGKDRRVLLWSAAVVLVWVGMASLRAGGDMWDNPRYRTMLLAWMALLAAWGWQYARQTQSPWLKRTWIVTGIFILGFMYWYFTRYVPGFGGAHVLVVLGGVGLAGAAVLIGGWLLDRRRAKRDQPRS